MKTHYLSLLLVVGVSLANASPAMKQDRQEIINKYLMYLQNGDYKSMYSLFEKNGIVVSTSKGKMHFKDFFGNFLPMIRAAKTETHSIFSSPGDHLAARFKFSYELKDGETGSGEYMDEFIFEPHSLKLRAVYMFENLKF